MVLSRILFWVVSAGLAVFGGPAAFARGPHVKRPISAFSQAKKVALRIHRENPVTIYCPCRYEGKTIDLRSCGYEVQSDARRAARLEWEHVVPAEAFGQAFVEWREGSPACLHKNGRPFKGRKCAETNPEFSAMEADLYNLWPIIGELNNLRSNFGMAEISGPARTFGGCHAKILDRKFEPEDEYKGIVARTYLYMDHAYPGRGIISSKNEKLFAAWDKLHPVTDWECRRANLIQNEIDRENPILVERCRPKNLTVPPPVDGP